MRKVDRGISKYRDLNVGILLWRLMFLTGLGGLARSLDGCLAIVTWSKSERAVEWDTLNGTYRTGDRG